MSDVFISYRGADRVLARRLEHRLRSRWGTRVFRDETGVTVGRKWAKEITDALSQARVILALIGPGWFISTDKKVEDWVRKELLAAIESGKPILPVLVGKSEELRPKLGSMPEAFRQQAVVVGPDLAGFDLHKIAQGLSNLGAFQTGEAWSLAARRREMVPQKKLDLARKIGPIRVELPKAKPVEPKKGNGKKVGKAPTVAAPEDAAQVDGSSLLIIGQSGSGRNALISDLVNSYRDRGHIVAYHGLDVANNARHTHAVIAGWINALATTFRCGQPERGLALVQAILDCGPDLLSRHVIKAGLLLPLGNTNDDQRILQATRRATDRWAPFPPKRLMNQSREVLKRLYEGLKKDEAILAADKKLIFVVDHFDSADSISTDLVKSLIKNPIDGGEGQVQFIIGAYEGDQNATDAISWLGDAKNLGLPVTRIDIESKGDELASNDWWEDHIERWLKSHHVELDGQVKEAIRSEPSPYQALAKLWYLVDRGFVREPVQTKQQRIAAKKKENSEQAIPVKVEWQFAEGGMEDSVQVSSEILLDHMIQENVPHRFRSLLEAGSLLGRVFSFRAAYAAVEPPSPDEHAAERLNSRERGEWSKLVEAAWLEFKKIDPDESVVRCSVQSPGEYLVSISQADLAVHLQSRVPPHQAQTYHWRLARYLSDAVELLGESDDVDFGHQYYLANQAAEQWSLAERLREGADAHRKAAEIAENSLAYAEAERHYHNAIRLYTQLLAERRSRNDEQGYQHEDLLLLANCYYRVGQTSRLSGAALESTSGELSAKGYLDLALAALADLRNCLLGDEPIQLETRTTAPRVREIPGPNLIRHHVRVYDSLAGHVQLEVARCHQDAIKDCDCRSKPGKASEDCDDCVKNHRIARDRLFDALRHAEAAQGEAGSRWLLAAASVQIAAWLTDRALTKQIHGERNTKKSEEVDDDGKERIVEAFFHIERIIGLLPYTREEESEFADSVSLAWRSAGKLARHYGSQARIAEWCYRKMNDHCVNVTASVDLITDRWLGGFLLSLCDPCESQDTIEEAEKLLIRHRDWSIESGILHWRTPAHLRLYLLSLVSHARSKASLAEGREKRMVHLANAKRHQDKKSHLKHTNLYLALESLLAGDSEAETKRLLQEIFPTEDENHLLHKGREKMASDLLRKCPRLLPFVKTYVLTQDEISDVRHWIQRAEKYETSLKANRRILSPALDGMIEELAKLRLPSNVYKQADRTGKLAHDLLTKHQAACEAEEEVDSYILRMDFRYAAFMHDWYRDTDPARLLTLASEWNLEISGQEWSNPRLLRGRLASIVLKRMYDAEQIVGKSRYDRISRMVNNCVRGKDVADCSSMEKIFFLANAIAEEEYFELSLNELRERQSILNDVKPDQFDLNEVYREVVNLRAQGLWSVGYTPPSEEVDQSISHLEPPILDDLNDDCETDETSEASQLELKVEKESKNGSGSESTEC